MRCVGIYYGYVTSNYVDRFIGQGRKKVRIGRLIEVRYRKGS